jgi:hypothetical protein
MNWSASIVSVIFVLLFLCCTTKKNTVTPTPAKESSNVTSANDTLKIANPELEYEVIIIEPGFNAWLNSMAMPCGYYSESFLENRNKIWVTEWNNRVLQPLRFNRNLYEMQIDYNPSIRYGYEVNYLIYNYFIYFQLEYKENLGTFSVRP